MSCILRNKVLENMIIRSMIEYLPNAFILRNVKLLSNGLEA